MPTMRHFLPFPLFTLVGLMACSGSNSEGPQGGAGGTGQAGYPVGLWHRRPARPQGVPRRLPVEQRSPRRLPRLAERYVPVTTAPASGTAVPDTTAAAGTTAAGGSVKPGGTTAVGGSAAGGSTPPAGGSSSAGGIMGGKGGICWTGGRLRISGQDRHSRDNRLGRIERRRSGRRSRRASAGQHPDGISHADRGQLRQVQIVDRVQRPLSRRRRWASLHRVSFWWLGRELCCDCHSRRSRCEPDLCEL
jgi:hypothetical protein